MDHLSGDTTNPRHVHEPVHGCFERQDARRHLLGDDGDPRVEKVDVVKDLARDGGVMSAKVPV